MLRKIHSPASSTGELKRSIRMNIHNSFVSLPRIGCLYWDIEHWYRIIVRWYDKYTNQRRGGDNCCSVTLYIYSTIIPIHPVNGFICCCRWVVYFCRKQTNGNFKWNIIWFLPARQPIPRQTSSRCHILQSGSRQRDPQYLNYILRPTRRLWMDGWISSPAAKNSDLWNHTEHRVKV